MALCIVALLLLIVCCGRCRVASATAAPLIPRTVLFGNPERTDARLSPDGRRLAYRAPDDNGVMQLWIRSLGEDDDRIVSSERKRGVPFFFWPHDGRQVIYGQDSDGDEGWHLYAIDLETTMTRDLTPFRGVRAEMIALSPSVPDEILVGLNLEDRRKHDVYRANLRNGAVELDTVSPGAVEAWTADENLVIRAGVVSAPDGGRELISRAEPDDEWTTIYRWSAAELGWTVGASPDGATLYVIGNHDSDTQRLLAVDVRSREETVLAEDAAYDVGETTKHPTRGHPQAAGIARETLEWEVVDEEIGADLAALDAIQRGQFHIASRDVADALWVVMYESDDASARFYLYERATRTHTLLFATQPQLDDAALAHMEPISFPSRDGLTLHGYLTLPVGVPARDLPTVVLVHGGPYGRDNWGYRASTQWLANRGYAVLQINFRGSTGYGKAFMNAGDREWAGKMHDDLLDGVDWLVERGTADRSRIAIMGTSYGGYATLVGLTFTPDVFAAGVDLVGPSNLVTFLSDIPAYWETLRPMLMRRIGDPEKDEEFLRSRSPLHFVDRIQAPLLIAQGANDPRVRQAESDQIAEAMRAKGKTVEYIVYTDEGHGLARPENRLHFFARAEAFLAEHLGGRAEPLSEVGGHSAVVQ
ncbi:S9 family peptidase [Candidatus Poribacteria bacterium]|jgi:dipeptidyl aminopeptidase/acylaminoacyl peptidase|nr:S9 family peptidase [Candidatus Poribacteria bacterium]MBT5535294.1 S9 family peptidase [Candidatus Poribacteria bacterium]MBT5710258.1 S9 family peptidase [Candidatus Poribacteria bacterium]MBT7100789.1 S9 family peptidase [Candidatus Poribacteria bacterium]MBT7805532.1 S9 family peptidase [Candidatus Poribacteria bacterium]